MKDDRTNYWIIQPDQPEKDLELLLVDNEEDGAQTEYTLSQWLGRESLKQIVESYIRYYAAGEGHTARAKRYDLDYFLQFLAKGKDPAAVSVSDWTMQATKDFVDFRLSVGEAPTTVCRRLATIKHLGRTLAERVRDFVNPAREVKSPSIQPTRPAGLSRSEVSFLLQAAEIDGSNDQCSFSQQRNGFLLQLLLATGLRADEARLLVLAQISTDFCWLKNVKTKGRKFRNVYLDSQIRQPLASYLKEREKELMDKTPGYADLNELQKAKFPLFISSYSAELSRPTSFGLSPKTIWRAISALGRKAQVLADRPLPSLHPHVLRHTFAHGLLDVSKDVRLVAQALGHSDVRTTMRYTERTEEELANAIERKVSSPH